MFGENVDLSPIAGYLWSMEVHITNSVYCRDVLYPFQTRFEPIYYKYNFIVKYENISRR
jgi:hypothetical protein